LPKDAPDDDGDEDNIVIIIKTVDPDEPVPSVVQVTLRLSTGFEDKTIRLAVMPKTFEVKRVVSLSTDEAVTVFAAEVKAAKTKAKKTATNNFRPRVRNHPARRSWLCGWFSPVWRFAWPATGSADVDAFAARHTDGFTTVGRD
jgi:hypothetical protein